NGAGSGGAAWIAPVVAADPEAELPWLASQYVPGPSVTEALMGFGPLSTEGLRTLTRGLALALAEVHAAGVVHRDVKPSNVLLARDGPRLIDFGVARAIDDVQLTRVGAVIGSPGFLSPEQALGKPASFGSDVFSMASVVAYAACGVGPFGAGAGPALLYRVVHEPPKLVNVPHELTEVLAACLVKDPADRPTAAEVAAVVAGTGADSRDASGPTGGGWLSEPVLADIARREAELAAWIVVAAGVDALRGQTVASADFEVVADTALELANAGIEFELAADTALKLANAGLQVGLATPPETEWDPFPETPFQGPPTPTSTDPYPPDAPPSISGDLPTPTIADQDPPDPPPSARIPARTPGLAPAHSPTRTPTSPPAQESTQEPAQAPAQQPDTSPANARPRTSHRRAGRRHRIPVYAAVGALLGAAAATTILLLPHGGHGAPQPPATTTGQPGQPGQPATHGTAPPTPSGKRSGPDGRTGSQQSTSITSASRSPR
ncbi:MAG: protein kinase, partial [Catenulispora sp.]|nr:protein kinase [Catenulispora sp.]